MLTYLDGIQIRETPRTAGQRRAMGAFLARLNLALRDFSHPAATHDLLWNVSAAHRLTAKFEAIDAGPRRALVESFMKRFTDHVLPRLGSVRAQVIHNDYHLYNVLVAPDDHERILGVIDFGDMLHAPLVGEVGTAAAFHMPSSELAPQSREAWLRSLIVAQRGQILPMGGALPIINGVTIVGAIGVAGASRAEQDVLCCRAALAVWESPGH